MKFKLVKYTNIIDILSLDAKLLKEVSHDERMAV
jgi:hypothetical protein